MAAMLAETEWNDDSEQIVIKLYISHPSANPSTMSFYKLDSKCCIDLFSSLCPSVFTLYVVNLE